MSELPLSSRCVNKMTIIKQRTLMEQASLCIYYMLIAVSCVHCSDATVKHEFSEQHMRIVNHQHSLISPIAVYGWNYKLFLVRSGSYWSRSARCEEICLNLCILGIYNWEIWNANSNGSGLTALCHLTRTFAVRSSLTLSGKIRWHHLKLKY